MKKPTEHLIYDENPAKERVLEFHEGLREYNAQFVGGDAVPFAAIVSTAEGKTVAGINGTTYWGRMHVENLWVAQSFRGQGIGSKLLRMAEDIARQRDCTGVDLDTMSFQAPEFYEKHGYRNMGVVPGFSKGHHRTYYSKEI